MEWNGVWSGEWSLIESGVDGEGSGVERRGERLRLPRVVVRHSGVSFEE